MYEDLLGKNKTQIQGYNEEINREMRDLLYEHLMGEFFKLSTFLIKEFEDIILNYDGTYVDTAIHILKRAIECQSPTTKDRGFPDTVYYEKKI